MHEVRDVLPTLLRRLYARHRARGVADEAARDEAVDMAAQLLACDPRVAREVMAQIPSGGVRRPL